MESKYRFFADVLQGDYEPSEACAMTEITLDEADLASLSATLISGDVERSGVLFASQARRSDGSLRLLVREYELPRAEEHITQEFARVVLKPEFVARVAKRARREGLSLIFAHSHPGLSSPRFSATDDEGERHLAAFLERRHQAGPHASLVISLGGVRARQLGGKTEVPVVSLGENRKVLSGCDDESGPTSDVFDRQVRAFGPAGQRAIARLRVGIVGLGGTGSIVAEQLAHLGVRSFILIDPDTVESTNLNRLVGASPRDIGVPKVDVAARLVSAVASDVAIVPLQGDIIRAQTALALRDADLVFGCTDSHGSRAVLQQIAYQYLIPCIDLGTTITTDGVSVSGVFGRVQLVAPGHGCFTCSDLLDPEEVRRDMMNAFERKLDPYIQGIREPAPSVISLNGTVASLAVTMFMAYVTGVPSPARYLLYNAATSSLRSARTSPKADCYICARSGVFARGDSQMLFARQD
ncbi:MAG TPA: ThiF family adenylyltransferase [Vicinamibacterales bacterium]|nr:ThiF family adenylyltransferase [Vicinamibacterales bacterium]